MAFNIDGLGDRLAAELTTLAICWRIVRRDGVALGFTTHDRPLSVGGIVHASAPGMTPSAIVLGSGLAIDTMDVAGALEASAITAADLARGRYDGAAVSMFMVDWRDPEGGAQPLAHGTLGTVEAGSGADASFTAMLRGPTAVLAATRIESCSPECRAELGDWRCRVAMRGRSRRTNVSGSDGERIRVATGSLTLGDHVGGRVRVASGPDAGIDRGIAAVEAGWLRFDEPLALAVGTVVELTQGCDKRFSTCVGRFGNGSNFRGEPHVPGGDVLTRFGGI